MSSIIEMRGLYVLVTFMSILCVCVCVCVRPSQRRRPSIIFNFSVGSQRAEKINWKDFNFTNFNLYPLVQRTLWVLPQSYIQVLVYISTRVKLKKL